VTPATNGECTISGGFVTPKQLSIPPWDKDWRNRRGGKGRPGGRLIEEREEYS